MTAAALSPEALANARTSVAFWTPLVRLPDVHVWALLGDQSGEGSFLIHPLGDKGEAFGAAQWHVGRVLNIYRETGIDVRKADYADQLRAMYWEMTTAIGYRHVFGHLNATSTIQDAVTVLVHEYEQSSQQARDVVRRTAIAEQLKLMLGKSS